MKHISRYFLIAALSCAAVSCNKEQMGAPEREVVIPVSLETAGVRTRVDADNANGDLTWTRGDRIAIYVTDGAEYNKYKLATVVDGAVRLTLADGQYRTGYAIYPYENRDEANAGVGGAELHINYPTAYSVGTLTPEQLETYSPLPMVAVNTETEIKFYNVGGLFRLKLTDVPANTTKIVVTFTGITYVTGNYTVTDPGTRTPSCTYSSGGGNTVTFNDLNGIDAVRDLVLNIPLPPQDYSALTSITVAATGGTSKSMTRIFGPAERWNPIGRSDGTKLTIGLGEEYIAISGSMDSLRGYYYSPGVMVWDATKNDGAGGYALTDGEDPLELLNHYGDDASLNVWFHQWREAPVSGQPQNTGTMKFRFDGNNNDSNTLSRPYVEQDGLTWRVPELEEYRTILEGAPAAPITINNSVATDKANNSRLIIVDISECPGYAGRGNSTDTGGASASEGTNYVKGTLLIPDGCTITCTRISPISYAALTKLIKGGCIFVLSTGGNRDNGWFLGHAGLTGMYWTATRVGSNISAMMYDNGLAEGYVTTWYNLRQFHYFAVHLIRTVTD